MTDLFGDASGWLESQRKANFTVTILYERSSDSVSLSATIGKTDFEQQDASGMTVSAEARDYLVDAADLVLTAQPIEPQRGDKIKETVGTTTFVYEVIDLGGGPAWHFSDPYRRVYRIHTKLVQII